jgi:hypothetical protein
MKRRLVSGLATIASVALVLIGCSHATGAGSQRTTCFPQQCVLDVQNDDSRIISVRYQDSTGVGDMLGLVRASAVRRFVLARRTSRTVIIEVRRDGEVFRVRATLGNPPSASVVHFPTDFVARASSSPPASYSLRR